MPVTDKHVDYKKYAGVWKRCRDTFDGSDAVKGARDTYLPMLSGQTKEEYSAYLKRALFYSIIGKSVSAMAGMAITKQPIVKYPERMASYFKDHEGTQIVELLVRSITEVLLMGRYGVLLDRSDDGGDVKILSYPTESILNWRKDESGKVVLVVLKEAAPKVNENDEFSVTYEDTYRVLRIRNGEYTESVYDETGKIKTPEFTPTNRGEHMTSIPFYVIGPSGINIDVEKSPTIDLVDINLSHYRTSADLEHGRHFTALPTPVVKGVDSSTVLKIGSSTAWVIPDAKGDAKYLEYTGQGLQSLEKALVEKQAQIANLSARMMDTSKRGSESPDTVRLRYMSEGSNLVTVVYAVQTLWSTVFKAIAVMEDEDPDVVTIKVDTGFLNTRLSTSDVNNLVKAYLDGGISKNTLLYNLRRGDMVSPEQSDDSELREIVDKALNKSQQNVGV